MTSGTGRVRDCMDKPKDTIGTPKTWNSSEVGETPNQVMPSVLPLKASGLWRGWELTEPSLLSTQDRETSMPWGPGGQATTCVFGEMEVSGSKGERVREMQTTGWC